MLLTRLIQSIPMQLMIVTSTSRTRQGRGVCCTAGGGERRIVADHWNRLQILSSTTWSAIAAAAAVTI